MSSPSVYCYQIPEVIFGAECSFSLNLAKDVVQFKGAIFFYLSSLSFGFEVALKTRWIEPFGIPNIIIDTFCIFDYSLKLILCNLTKPALSVTLNVALVPTMLSFQTGPAGFWIGLDKTKAIKGSGDILTNYQIN